MSALPVPPLPPSEQPPRRPIELRRRRNWKGIVGWIAAGIGVLICLIIVAIIVLLHNAAFHRYLLRTAQAKASAALGTQVRLRDFALHWSGISPILDLYSAQVDGAGPHPTPPLVQVDHVHVAVRITSLLRRTWYLSDITLDRPVVHVFVDRQGTSNLPASKSSGNGHTSVFDLGVRHALLDRGEVYFNDRKSVLSADLHDFNFRAAFDPAQIRYAGTLSYRDGHLQYGAYHPIPHDLDAQFAATPQAFTLDRAALRSGASRFVLSATVEDYSHPRVRATYDATVDVGEFRRLLRDPSLPSGVILAKGSLQYATEPNLPALQTATLNGDLSSRALDLRSPGIRAQIRDISARYTLANGNLDVRDIRAALLGGEITGALAMRNLPGTSRSHLVAELRGISLADLKSLMNASSMQQVAIRGQLNATADATWGKSFNDLVARTDATVKAGVSPTGGGNPLPVNGIVHARYTAPSKTITLTQSYLRTPQTAITLNGTVSNRSSLQIQLRSSDLHELETVANNFRKPAPGQPVQPLGLYGTAVFTGAVHGSTTAPELTGQLTASNLRLRNSAWKVLRTNIDVSPSLASLQNGELQPVEGGRVTFDLSARLRRWAFTEGSPFRVDLHAANVNLEPLVKAAGVQKPIKAVLAANVSLHGSELNPVGGGTVSLKPASDVKRLFDSVSLNFQGTGNEVHANLDAHSTAGAAKAVLTYFPRQQGYEVQLQTTDIQLEKLQPLKAEELAGVVRVTASGQGTLTKPGLQATVQVPWLAVHNQTVSGLTLQTTVANHVANFALDSQVANTSARARGRVDLTGEYYADLSLDTQRIPLAPLVAAYAPAQAGAIGGETELHATLRGPLKNKPQLEAHVTIPTLALNYKSAVQLAAASPIHIDFANGVLALQRAALRGTGTDLQFQGTIPMNSAAPASLLLLGTVDLRMVQLIDPDISSSGQVQFDINSYGPRASADVQGRVNIVNANFATGTVPVGLQNGNGVLTLTKDRLNITQFSGLIGGGRVQASGGIVYRPSLKFDLAMAGNGIRVLYPEGVRSGFDVNMALTGTTDAALLRGQVRIDQLQFTPDFDLTNLAGQFGGVSTPPPAQGFSNNLQLDLAVQSTSGVNLVSRTMSLQAAANLHVVGTAAEPVVLGRINVNGGDLIFMGNRYVLQGGTIDFVNPTRTQPVLDVAVNTTIQQYNIQMRFWGPADHLHTNYASDPALPPADIINLLAFGKTSEASAANPTPPGNMGAESLVASQVSSQITNRLEKIAGISQLSLDPLRGCNQQSTGTGACITVQQRVTSKIFVTFSTDVTSTQRDTVQFEYQYTPRVSFSATRNQNGGFGFDTRIKKSW